MTHKPSWAWIALLLLVTAAGCIAEFVHPLSDPAKAKVDVALLGTWESVDKDDDTIFEIARKDQHWIALSQTNEPDSVGFTSVVGDRKYLNMKQDNGRYILVEYQVTPQGQLNVWLLDDDVFEQAIKSGRLKGSLEDGDTVVTASARKVRRMLVKLGDKARATEHPGVMRKVARATLKKTNQEGKLESGH